MVTTNNGDGIVSYQHSFFQLTAQKYLLRLVRFGVRSDVLCVHCDLYYCCVSIMNHVACGRPKPNNKTKQKKNNDGASFLFFVRSDVMQDLMVPESTAQSFLQNF